MTGKESRVVKAAAAKAWREGRYEALWGWRAIRGPFLPGNGTYAEQMAMLAR